MINVIKINFRRATVKDTHSEGSAQGKLRFPDGIRQLPACGWRNQRDLGA
jgi:hypothetical protein